MKFEVTQEHIEKGKAADCLLCPVSLAILAVLPNSAPVVLPIAIGLKAADKTDYCLDVPQAVKDFISNFDSGKPVQPFTFELPI